VSAEREIGLPFAAFMETKTEKERAQAELNFIKFVVRPWWESAIRLLPSMAFTIQYLDSNVAKYNEILDSTPVEEAQPST
jgi:hypothetical protein